MSPEFNKDQIYIRSTNVNRTIDSALSQLQGLYEGATPFKLSKEQQEILPPFKVRKEVVKETKKNLGDSALPNNMAAIPVHVPANGQEFYGPDHICKAYAAAKSHFAKDSYVEDTLTKKYQEHVNEYGMKFFGVPYYFTALMEMQSSDNVYAHWLDRRPTPGLDQHFIDTMMNIRRDAFLHKNCGADWQPKLYTTHALRALLQEFSSAIEANEKGEIDRPDRRRFYYWSDHDTGVQAFACAFSFVFQNYIALDSQVLI